jgi:shikimate dehydrogenase
MTAAGGHVLIAMGDHGLASRVLSTRIGNRWTYAGDNVAPGQVSAQRMLDEFRFHDLRPGTAVYGVVGNPVMHSLSPVMHNAGFRHFGIDAVYLPLLAKDAADFVAFARALGLAGASITAPFKVHLMEAVDELEPLAQRVGAINTLTVRDGRWLGANTDVYGFAAPLIARLRDLPAKAGWDLPASAGSPAAGLRTTILAAGGAARAVAVALADLGADVTVCARRPEAAREVAALATGQTGELPPPAGSWDVLVNTTTWDGDAASYSPIAPDALDGRLVYDLLYVPPVTKLMADATAAGVHDHRRARDARRAGREAVRNLDGADTAGRALSAGGRTESVMKQTSYEEFVELSRRGTFVPVVKEIIADLLTPVSAFLKIAEHSDYAFLFESVEGGERVARYSFLGKDPFLVLKARGRQTTIDRAGVRSETDEPFIAVVRRIMAEFQAPVCARAAALHRRRGRVHRLRRRAAVRAGALAGVARRLVVIRTGGRRCGLHVVRHGAGVRSREAPHPHRRQRAHHRGRGPAGALPVRVREDPVPGARARAQPVAVERPRA